MGAWIEIIQVKTDILAQMETKANIDGYYEPLSVGTADNLAGKGDGVGATFIHRTTGEDADVADGTATIKSIHGNTIVWNQLLGVTSSNWNYEGIVITNKGDGSWEISGTPTTPATFRLSRDGSTNKNYKGVNGEKWLIMVGGDLSDLTGICLSLVVDGINVAPIVSGGTIVTLSGSTDMVINIAVWVTSEAVNVKIAPTTIKPMLVNLTKMFYAGKEPATVAEFKALFPSFYYSYNPGHLLNFNVTGIKTVGFNQFDLLKGYAKALAGNKYVVGGALTKLEFAETLAGTKVEIDTTTEDDVEVYVPKKNGYVFVTDADETTIIHLKWSGIRDGEFEEYWESERELPIATYFPDGMCSAGVSCDELTKDRAVQRIIKYVLDGTEPWITLQPDLKMQYYAFNIGVKDSKITNSVVSTHYSHDIVTSNTTMQDIIDVIQSSAGYSRIAIRPSLTTYPTVELFKNYLAAQYAAGTPVIVYCALATPIETPIKSELNLSYKVSDFGTEEIISDNEDMPQTSPFVGNIIYGMNAVDTLRRLPTEYISKNTMISFITGLENAINHNIVMIWDESTQKYKFVFIEKENGGDEE